MGCFSLTRDPIIPMKESSLMIYLIFSFQLIPDFLFANQGWENLNNDQEFVSWEQFEEDTLE